MAGSDERQLRKLANAMHEIAEAVDPLNPNIGMKPLLDACRLLDMEKLGIGAIFYFVSVEIKELVDNIEKKTRPGDTVQSAVERDIAEGNFRLISSLSRSIYRLKRALELVMITFEQVLAHQGNDSFANAISLAYGQVFAPYHGPFLRQVFLVAKVAIPTLSNLLNGLHEDENSVKEPFNKYITAARVVVTHIETVFQSDESIAELTERL